MTGVAAGCQQGRARAAGDDSGVFREWGRLENASLARARKLESVSTCAKSFIVIQVLAVRLF